MSGLLTRTHVFERGDKVFITTPLTLGKPSSEQVEEFAFASTVKKMAPNENIGWLQGRYVEADRPNLNNAMWLNEELALKALTPMLMPVTVMHDPRTAVGTIADCKLFDEERSRIETMLAVWRHRFSDVWEEAEANIKEGTMMQSMECLAPWYSCSECGESYVKLAQGKEQAGWCAHLQSNSSCRILGDVCFTGTGLIFGTRGGQGAYTEAHLDHFQDEIAEFHQRAHIDARYTPREEPPKMGFVQIDETELATLRSERETARREADEKATENRELTSKVEKAEADLSKEKERADGAEKERDGLKENAEKAQLKDTRWGKLGSGFVAKLGDTTKTRLQEQAGTMTDDEWSARLDEVEEMLAVKRDATADGSKESGKEGEGEGSEDAGVFKDKDLEEFAQRGVTRPARTNGSGNGARALARSLSKPRPAEKAGATK